MSQTAEKIQAPAQWAELLHQAVTVPGIMSKAYQAFHNYSVGNMVLLVHQLRARGMDLGPVATYKGWQKKGLQVQKGERSLMLCQPQTRVRRNEEGEIEKAWTAFEYKLGWFTIHQTNANFTEFSTPPEWNLHQALVRLEIKIEPFKLLDGNCQGYAYGKTIALNPVAEQPIKTAIHEIAHIVLGHTAELMGQTDQFTPKDVRELEAEAVAMLLTDALGLGNIEESRAYIQHWYRENAVSERVAQRIFTAAQKILTAGRPLENKEEE